MTLLSIERLFVSIADNMSIPILQLVKPIAEAHQGTYAQAVNSHPKNCKSI